MKTFMFFLILNGALFCGCSQDVKEYKDLSKGYSFSYSEKWEGQVINGQMVFFVKASNADKSGFRNNINVLVQDLSKSQMDLEGYHRLTKKQIKDALTQNTIEKERSINVSSQPAKEIIYTIPQDPSKQRYFNLKLKQVYLIKNNIAYLITYTALTSEFDEYLKSANIVFDTFSLSK